MINLHRIWFTKIHTGILTIITRDTICTEIQVLIISFKDLLNLNSLGFEVNFTGTEAQGEENRLNKDNTNKLQGRESRMIRADLQTPV